MEILHPEIYKKWKSQFRFPSTVFLEYKEDNKIVTENRNLTEFFDSQMQFDMAWNEFCQFLDYAPGYYKGKNNPELHDILSDYIATFEGFSNNQYDEDKGGTLIKRFELIMKVLVDMVLHDGTSVNDMTLGGIFGTMGKYNMWDKDAQKPWDTAQKAILLWRNGDTHVDISGSDDMLAEATVQETLKVMLLFMMGIAARHSEILERFRAENPVAVITAGSAERSDDEILRDYAQRSAKRVALKIQHDTMNIGITEIADDESIGSDEESRQEQQVVNITTADEGKRVKIILGIPGAGKSTLLNRRFLRMLNRYLAGEQPLVPIMVALADIGSDTSFAEMVASGLKKGNVAEGDAHELARRLIDEDRVTLYIDGLNELRVRNTESWLRNMVDNIALLKKSEVCITGRIYEFGPVKKLFDGMADSSIYEMEEITQETVMEYLDTLGLSEEQRAVFTNAGERIADIDRLLTSPLNFKMLVSVLKDNVDLAGIRNRGTLLKPFVRKIFREITDETQVDRVHKLMLELSRQIKNSAAGVEYSSFINQSEEREEMVRKLVSGGLLAVDNATSLLTFSLDTYAEYFAGLQLVRAFYENGRELPADIDVDDDNMLESLRLMLEVSEAGQQLELINAIYARGVQRRPVDPTEPPRLEAVHPHLLLCCRLVSTLPMGSSARQVMEARVSNHLLYLANTQGEACLKDILVVILPIITAMNLLSSRSLLELLFSTPWFTRAGEIKDQVQLRIKYALLHSCAREMELYESMLDLATSGHLHIEAKNLASMVKNELLVAVGRNQIHRISAYLAQRVQDKNPRVSALYAADYLFTLVKLGDVDAVANFKVNLIASKSKNESMLTSLLLATLNDYSGKPERQKAWLNKRLCDLYRLYPGTLSGVLRYFIFAGKEDTVINCLTSTSMAGLLSDDQLRMIFNMLPPAKIPKKFHRLYEPNFFDYVVANSDETDRPTFSMPKGIERFLEGDDESTQYVRRQPRYFNIPRRNTDIAEGLSYSLLGYKHGGERAFLVTDRLAVDMEVRGLQAIIGSGDAAQTFYVEKIYEHRPQMYELMFYSPYSFEMQPAGDLCYANGDECSGVLKYCFAEREGNIIRLRVIDTLSMTAIGDIGRRRKIFSKGTIFRLNNQRLSPVAGIYFALPIKASVVSLVLPECKPLNLDTSGKLRFVSSRNKAQRKLPISVIPELCFKNLTQDHVRCVGLDQVHRILLFMLPADSEMTHAQWLMPGTGKNAYMGECRRAESAAQSFGLVKFRFKYERTLPPSGSLRLLESVQPQELWFTFTASGGDTATVQFADAAAADAFARQLAGAFAVETTGSIDPIILEPAASKIELVNTNDVTLIRVQLKGATDKEFENWTKATMLVARRYWPFAVDAIRRKQAGGIDSRSIPYERDRYTGMALIPCPTYGLGDGTLLPAGLRARLSAYPSIECRVAGASAVTLGGLKYLRLDLRLPVSDAAPDLKGGGMLTLRSKERPDGYTFTFDSLLRLIDWAEPEKYHSAICSHLVSEYERAGGLYKLNEVHVRFFSHLSCLKLMVGNTMMRDNMSNVATHDHLPIFMLAYDNSSIRPGQVVTLDKHLRKSTPDMRFSLNGDNNRLVLLEENGEHVPVDFAELPVGMTSGIFEGVVVAEIESGCHIWSNRELMREVSDAVINRSIFAPITSLRFGDVVRFTLSKSANKHLGDTYRSNGGWVAENVIKVGHLELQRGVVVNTLEIDGAQQITVDDGAGGFNRKIKGDKYRYQIGQEVEFLKYEYASNRIFYKFKNS